MSIEELFAAQPLIEDIKTGRVYSRRSEPAAIVVDLDAQHRATDDYRRRILHGGDGDTITTTWGRYRRRGAFHYRQNDLAIQEKISDGLWICNGCWQKAKPEHGRAECHRCQDWGDCGRDCQLTAVSCPDCGTRQDV